MKVMYLKVKYVFFTKVDKLIIVRWLVTKSYINASVP